MIKNIILNLEAIEALNFFWVAASEKDNVAEKFFHDLGQMPAVKLMYEEGFDSESVRRALSAIKNREPFSGNHKERKFWNLNMWAMEDLELTDMMVQPIKKLNLSGLIDPLNKIKTNNNSDILEVYFSPLYDETSKVVDGKLLINFFRVKTSFVDDSVTLEGLSLSEYIQVQLEKFLSN